MAALAGCSEKTVRRAVEAGQIRAFRPARRVVIREDDAQRWVQARSDRVDAVLPVEAPGEPAVYLIQRGEDGPVKIGYVGQGARLRERIEEIQGGSAERLYLRALITTRADEHLELVLHNRFAAHRLMGEWFKPVAEILDYFACSTTSAWAGTEPAEGASREMGRCWDA